MCSKDLAIATINVLLQLGCVIRYKKSSVLVNKIFFAKYVFVRKATIFLKVFI